MTSGEMFERTRRIATAGFAEVLGLELVEVADDRVVVRMPYSERLGTDRVNGGAMAALVDIASTAAFWALPGLGPQARGATVDFTIHFLRLAVGVDLHAEATVRRRGGTLCTGDVSIRSPDGQEMAVARVTYKLTA